MKTTTFDVAAAIPAAWALLWADNVRKRAAGEDFRGNTTYLTASDLEGQVRTFAQEQMDGDPWGATGRSWGRGMTDVRIVTGRPGGVFAACRDWLLREERAGRLEGFNHDRGHVSGMRFRPAGQGPTATEERTVAENARRRTTPRPVHLSASGLYGGRPACVKRVGSFYRGSRYTRSTAERGNITCPRCLKRMAEAV